jgi:short-subunit dehydrogenase
MLAIITGASSGLGAAFARKLAARGYDLLLVARREDRLKTLATELQDRHRVKAEILTADLIDETDCERVAERIRGASNLGLVVNNAGFGTNGYFFETDLSGQIDMHKLHVLAVVRLCHAAIQNLTGKSVQQEQTGVINVSSVASFTTAPHNASYSATKRWMNMFTAGLALELSATGKNITLQSLCPGYTITEFQDRLSVDKSRIPKWLWMTSDFVVEESLKGFDRRKLIVVPGWRYKVAVAAMKVLPGSVLRWAIIRGVRRYRRNKAS